MTGRIVCVGNAVFDEVFQVKAMPQAGTKTPALGYRESGGGPAATAAIAIARLGGSAAWWGRVGDDTTGAALLERLRREGVDLSGAMVMPGCRTIRAIVLVDAAGERSIVVHRGNLPMEVNLTPAHDLAGAAVLLADTRWPQGAEDALRLARDLPRVLDADSGGAETIGRLAALADHVVFSEQGLRELTGLADAEQGLRLAAARLSGVLAVTCGAAGSLWWIDGAISRVPAFRVVARDTTGCGDVFHGAYALGLAEGFSPLDAARFASATAAAKAERGNGWDGMPDRATVMDMMRQEIEA